MQTSLIALCRRQRCQPWLFQRLQQDWFVALALSLSVDAFSAAAPALIFEPNTGTLLLV